MEKSEIEYRDIPGFPGYRVGSDGSVWTCKKVVSLGGRLGARSELSDTWCKRKQSLTQGYFEVCLWRVSRGYTQRVHRLVAICFLGPCPDGMQVCHNDGTRTNNVPANLRYGTCQENAADAIRHGATARGERCGSAKLTDDKVCEIRRLGATGMTQADRSKIFGVRQTTISRIDRGELWSHLLETRPVVVEGVSRG